MGILSNIKAGVEVDMKSWCEEVGIKDYRIINYELYISENVDLRCMSGPTIPYPIYSVCGDFICPFDIDTLENTPRVVSGVFDCSNCKHLTSLKGGPEAVRDYICSENYQLTSLEGVPREVMGTFDCSWTGVTSLKGGPEVVLNSYSCIGCRGLTTLKGAPKKVPENFNASCCSRLKSLIGAPKWIGNKASFKFLQITSLRGLPTYVGKLLNMNFLLHINFPEELKYKYRKVLTNNI